MEIKMLKPFIILATVAGGLGAIGLTLPQIATKDEVAKIAGDVRVLQQEQAQSAIESYELRELRLKQEIEEKRKQGGSTSNLESEVIILQKRKTRAANILENLLKEKE